jgi:hypothetical protein
MHSHSYLRHIQVTNQIHENKSFATQEFGALMIDFRQKGNVK